MRKEALIIIAFKNFQDRELLISKKILKEQGVKITIASKFLGSATGVLGNKAVIDISLSEVLSKVTAGKYDVIIFIGGQGVVDYINDHTCHQILQQAVEKKKVIAAICVAPAILAQAGVLKNKKATVWASELNRELIKLFKKNEVNYQDQAVVVDRKSKIITANGPEAVEEFSQAILNLLDY